MLSPRSQILPYPVFLSSSMTSAHRLRLNLVLEKIRTNPVYIHMYERLRLDMIWVEQG